MCSFFVSLRCPSFHIVADCPHELLISSFFCCCFPLQLRSLASSSFIWLELNCSSYGKCINNLECHHVRAIDASIEMNILAEWEKLKLKFIIELFRCFSDVAGYAWIIASMWGQGEKTRGATTQNAPRMSLWLSLQTACAVHVIEIALQSHNKHKNWINTYVQPTWFNNVKVTLDFFFHLQSILHTLKSAFLTWSTIKKSIQMEPIVMEKKFAHTIVIWNYQEIPKWLKSNSCSAFVVLVPIFNVNACKWITGHLNQSWNTN